VMGEMTKELFGYNRDNFKFDQGQRLEREMTQINMQLKRFQLFREDIRDLVELTVGRMDVYHVVGALLTGFSITLLVGCRVEGEAPAFLLSLFLMSNASAFVFLLTSVWLSMHASLAAHSFGVRLLTRFVRLPVPNTQQIDSLKNKMADFESQGIMNLIKLPGMAAQEWQRPCTEGEQHSGCDEASLTSGSPQRSPRHERSKQRGSSLQSSLSLRGASSGLPSSNRHASFPVVGAIKHSSLPGRSSLPVSRPGHVAFAAGVGGSGTGSRSSMVSSLFHRRSSIIEFAANPEVSPGSSIHNAALDEQDLHEVVSDPLDLAAAHEEVLMRQPDEVMLSANTSGKPGAHLELFRRLQSKWQCYDAYCRVCMGLGVSQLLQGLTYFGICYTLTEQNSPSIGFAMMIIFQSAAVAISILDIAGANRCRIVLLQLLGCLPAAIAGAEVCLFWNQSDGHAGDHLFRMAPLCFIIQVIWFELLLRTASPGGDSAMPRKFRAVLFLDVFGDAGATVDPGTTVDPAMAESRAWAPRELAEEAPSSAEEAPSSADKVACQARVAKLAEVARMYDKAREVEEQLQLAMCAVRRWEAVDPTWLTEEQKKELQNIRDDFSAWSHIHEELLSVAAMRGPIDQATSSRMYALCEDPLRPWRELPPAEKQADRFARTRLGPLTHIDSYGGILTFWYLLEDGSKVWKEDDPSMLKLKLSGVAACVKDLGRSAKSLTERGQDGAAAQPDSSFLRDENSDGSFFGIADLRDFDNSSIVRPRLSSDENYQPGRDDSVVEMSSMTPRTLEARRQRATQVAGPEEKFFAPPQLPWEVLSGMVRVLQLCWFFMCVMSLLREFGIFHIDFENRVHHKAKDLNGLFAMKGWSFEHIGVEWPDGAFFRPELLSHLPNMAGGLLVGSPYALYWTDANQAKETQAMQLQLEELASSSLMPSSSLLCAPESRPPPLGTTVDTPPCLLGAPTKEGVALWPVGHDRWGSTATILPVQGATHWRSLAGAILPCIDIAEVLMLGNMESIWCLLLVGWDGSRLPVTAVPLALPGASDSQAEEKPVVARGTQAKVRFDIPLLPSDSQRNITALHVQPQTGRLWALLGSDELQAWDLVGFRSLGRWRPQWPFSPAASFQAAAVCEDLSHGVFVMGRLSNGGREPLPSLFRAELPVELAAQ